MVTYLGSVKRGRESSTKLAMLPRAFQNQTQFPLYTFATAPSIHHISNCDHRIYKNTERFLSPAPKPSVPWTPPHSVEFVCIFTIESLTSLSVTKSCCQEENHSSAVTYGKKRREDVTRRTETAKKKGDMIALPPPPPGRWRMPNSLVLSLLPRKYTLWVAQSRKPHVGVIRKWDSGRLILYLSG